MSSIINPSYVLFSELEEMKEITKETPITSSLDIPGRLRDTNFELRIVLRKHIHRFEKMKPLCPIVENQLNDWKNQLNSIVNRANQDGSDT